MVDIKALQQQRQRRKHRVRAKVTGTAERPRLVVSLTNKHVIAQLIDDERGYTLAYASTVRDGYQGTMTRKAEQIGTEIAKRAKQADIKRVVFDRGAKQYHGRVKVLAEAARQGGLEF